MGLDTTHNCWHGSYSSFNKFRYSLGYQIGIDLDEYIGYRGDKATKQLSSIEHGIMPLLNHSDCDGELSVKEARVIAKGLKDILDNFNPDLPMDIGFKEDVEKFMNGCLSAVKKRQKIYFR